MLKLPTTSGLSAPGDRTAAKIEKLLAWLETLKAELGIRNLSVKLAFRKRDFTANVDKLSEDAFDDQCTGANPRYPADLRAETDHCWIPTTVVIM